MGERQSSGLVLLKKSLRSRVINESLHKLRGLIIHKCQQPPMTTPPPWLDKKQRQPLTNEDDHPQMTASAHKQTQAMQSDDKGPGMMMRDKGQQQQQWLSLLLLFYIWYCEHPQPLSSPRGVRSTISTHCSHGVGGRGYSQKWTAADAQQTFKLSSFNLSNSIDNPSLNVSMHLPLRCSQQGNLTL